MLKHFFLNIKSRRYVIVFFLLSKQNHIIGLYRVDAVMLIYPPMDGWTKSGRDKISARGPQIGPNVHHTYENVNQGVTVNLPLASANRSSADAGAPSYSSTPRIGFENVRILTQFKIFM
jgi:hypothetical protein